MSFLRLKNIVFIGFVLLVTGCRTLDSNEKAGSFLGGASGAVIGTQFGNGGGQILSIAGGALAGAYLGGVVGRMMTERDRHLSTMAAQNNLENLPDHNPVNWHNPNSGHRGSFWTTGTKEYPHRNIVCREFVQTVLISGQQEQAKGLACRDLRDVNATWYLN